MSNIIPLISSGTAGPLGVLHLPRLWQKASLGAAGKLHPDYPSCGQGYDQMVLSGLGLDKAAFESFIAEQKADLPANSKPGCSPNPAAHSMPPPSRS